MFLKDLLFRHRLSVVFFSKTVIITSSLLLAYGLRFDISIPSNYFPTIFYLILLAIPIKMAIFWQLGCCRGWWRYVAMPDLIQIAKANLVGSVVLIGASAVIFRMENIPRSVLILDGLLCFLFICGVRFITRAVREHYFPMGKGFDLKQSNVLLVGAGDAGQMIAREIRQNPTIHYNLVGFVDDDPYKKKAVFQGYKVLGQQDQLSELVDKFRVDEIIIAIPSASGKQIRSIVEKCQHTCVRVKILPGVGDIIGGKVSVQQIRNVDLNDLLGREPIKLDELQIRNYLTGKRVLVTGAGGSIGSELCRQIAGYNPDKLILFENGETPLFAIEQELLNSFPDISIIPIIGDIRNPARVNGIFDEQMPQVVFHAAAYKHVPMMERNPAESVNNNVRGTRLLADAADHFKVEKFVMVSTDKAVRPTNIMGTTKRIAELYVQALNKRSKTNFVTTRFGNVLGSNGSVIPTFKEQINKGGPLTVTDPEVTRFFMTIPEAVQLVLQAGSMGQGGEIYLFDMGSPVKIKHLAEELIRLSGYKPYEDIDIVYTGLRPGEKLYEELLLDGEGTVPTQHPKICIAKSIDVSYEKLKVDIEALLSHAKDLDIPGVVSYLHQLVPEYTPAQNSIKIEFDYKRSTASSSHLSIVRAND